MIEKQAGKILAEHSYLKKKTKHFFFLKKVVSEDSVAKLILSWDPPHKKDKEKIDFIDELYRLDKTIPEGLIEYIRTTKKLYQNYNQSTKHNFDLKYSSPQRQINLININDSFIRAEKSALPHLDKIAILLIAGGLGERLSFSDIKLKLPCHQIFSATYLSYYAAMIKSLELIYEQNLLSKEASPLKPRKIKIPFLIMTSQETDTPIKQYLAENSYFHLKKNQVIFLKQNSVPCFEDFSGNLATKNPYSIKLKPSGHGSVHYLMNKFILKKKSLDKKKYLFFMQDTNLQVTNVLLSSLGIHVQKKNHFSWIGVNRKAHEKMGLIIEARGRKTSKKIYNLEYNLIEKIKLEQKSQGFLGNTNMFWIDLAVYKKTLAKTKGIIRSFVNPKIEKGGEKFKVVNRKESLMQDIVKDLPDQNKISVIAYFRNFSFAPVKNQLTDLINNPYSKSYTPLQADEINFKNNRDELTRNEIMKNKFIGQEKQNTLLLHLFTSNLCKVFLHPYFRLFHSRKKGSGEKYRVINSTFHPKSIFILNLPLVEINGLVLSSGSMLIIDGHPEARLKIDNIKIKNHGYRIIPLKEKDYTSNDFSILDKLFGYKFIAIKPLKILLKKKGAYRLTKELMLKKI